MSMMIQPYRFVVSGGGGAPPPDEFHRYWRIRFLRANGSSFTMMNKLEIYDQAGIVDYMQTATITTSPAPQDGSVANLKDNSLSTYCQFGTENATMTFDMGAGNEPGITRWVMNGGGAGGFIDRAPGVFIIQHSDDNATWTTHMVMLPAGTWTYGVAKTFDLPAFGDPAEYWGITVNGTARGYTSISTLGLYAETHGENLAVNATEARARDNYGGYEPSKAFDTDPSSFYSSSSANMPNFLVARLAEPAMIIEITVRGRPDDLGADDSPTSGMVVYSHDGVTYRVYFNYEFSGWADYGQTKRYTKPEFFDPTIPTYDSAIGIGNRTSAITVTTNGITAGGGNPTQLLNGAYDNSYWWTNAANNGTQWMKFDFGSGNAWVIDAINLIQNVNASHGVWRLEGSNDDSTWTQVGVDITLQRNENVFGNPDKDAYRYYRIRAISGNRSQSPYLQEMEFRAALPG